MRSCVIYCQVKRNLKVNQDKLYRQSNSKQYNYAINDARKLIEKAISIEGKKAVAVSGGKDSVAMAHLVNGYCKPILIFNDSGLEPPESIVIIEKLAKQLDCELKIAKADALSFYCEKHELSQNDVDKIINKPTLKILEENDIALEFVGLREKESIPRRILIRKNKGLHYNKKWGCNTCYPMRKWTAEDCYAYIDEYDLPLHPAYLRTEWQKRESIRVSWIYDDQWIGNGQVEYCRKYYPETYRKLRDLRII